MSARCAKLIDASHKAMELRHLRYFVAVAEELHFTRAAERLGIKQPPLSLQIRHLEREMGTSLFRRETRGVKLTEAGALLLDEARRILDQVERTKTGVQSRARGETGHIHVGFAGATYVQRLVPGIIRAYRERYPGVVLTPEQSNTARLIAALQAGEIDVAFVRPPIIDGEGVALDPLIDEPMMIVLPEWHPHAGDPSMPLAALAPETFILFPRALGPGLHDSIIASCQRAGFSPKLGQEASQTVSIIHMVAAGFGVSIVPQSLEQIRVEGVVYLGIEGEAPRALVSLAYRRDDRSMIVRNLVALARQTAQSAPEKKRTS
jgi:DNA-binding transcriptional LysR family regulator